MNDAEVLFKEISGNGGAIGQVILNRPKALNSLTLEMCQLMLKQMEQWADDSNIKAVIIKSTDPRSFCAGGDVKNLYLHRDMPLEKFLEFFKHEYALDSKIYHFPKPYISLLDGITMGGGAGISIHGSHRVATENFKFAMPETAIGFFPDIGAGYFLSRCPYKVGWYLGLTGTVINRADAYTIGIVNHAVGQQQLEALEHALIENYFLASDGDAVTAIINKFSITPEPAKLSAQYKIINDAFSQPSVEAIIEYLQKFSDEFCQSTLKTLLSRSPTSLVVTFEYLIRCQNLSFDEIIQSDLKLTKYFLQSYDLYEGIRAVLVDKDQKPKWKPDKLSEVKINDFERILF